MCLQRLTTMFRDLGHEVIPIAAELPIGCEAEMLVALNAWRSAEAVLAFKECNPTGQVVIKVTGTELSRDPQSTEWLLANNTIKAAEVLVFSQPQAQRIAEAQFGDLEAKSHLIYPSTEVPLELNHQRDWQKQEGRKLSIILAGNAREEKNPAFLSRLQESSNDLENRISVKWFGEADTCSRSIFKELKQSAKWFQWKGGLTQKELWEEMTQADLLLNVSSEEGGANAICESISMGLPVLASRIPGNVGLLGEDYPGYFGLNDPQQLQDLIDQIHEEQDFYALLGEAVNQRAALFSYENERLAWEDLFSKMTSN